MKRQNKLKFQRIQIEIPSRNSIQWNGTVVDIITSAEIVEKLNVGHLKLLHGQTDGYTEE